MDNLVSFPNYLSHYHEFSQRAFRNLSSLSTEQAEEILGNIRQEGKIFASKRPTDYLSVRRELEMKIKSLFIEKGGETNTNYPHYMILGSCEWLQKWYKIGSVVQIPLDKLNTKSISFTYGDSFPAMRFQDGKPYRGQVFIFEELSKIISQFGLPQEWNKNGELGPERYIEAQVWDDEVLRYV